MKRQPQNMMTSSANHGTMKAILANPAGVISAEKGLQNPILHEQTLMAVFKC